jgi:type IV pilus assembly protein PilA
MKKFAIRNLIRERGQGMTEYIIIVALIAVAAIGVYQAFGKVVRGQTAVASSALSGSATTAGRKAANDGSTESGNEAAKKKTMKDFDENATQ